MGFELGLVLVALAGWALLFGGYLLATRPRPVTPAPPTWGFGGEEPPAVVGLLAHGWEVTDAVTRSTMLDLAARQFLRLRQPGSDPRLTTVRLSRSGAGDNSALTGYERRVLDRIRTLAGDGVIPLAALTFRDAAQERAWSRLLKAEVLADARARGLSRRRLSRHTRAVLTVAAAVAAVAVLVAMVHHDHRTHAGYGLVAPATVFTFALLAALANKSLGERDTPAGRAAAARWLGLRNFLRRDQAFGALGPAAVGPDRYLAYGAALGVARGCDQTIDLGLGERTLVWSSFGGTWHPVRVHCPRRPGPGGRNVGVLAARAAGCLAVGAVLLRLRGGSIVNVIGHPGDVISSVILLAGLLLVIRGVYRLARVVADVPSSATITGEVLWEEVWRSKPSDDEDAPPEPTVFYLAVDDGRRDASGHHHTTAWALPRALQGRCHVGDVVRLRARPWTREILEVTVATPGRARGLSTETAGYGTERLITDALKTRGQDGNGPASSVTTA